MGWGNSFLDPQQLYQTLLGNIARQKSSALADAAHANQMNMGALSAQLWGRGVNDSSIAGTAAAQNAADYGRTVGDIGANFANQENSALLNFLHWGPDGSTGSSGGGGVDSLKLGNLLNSLGPTGAFPSLAELFSNTQLHQKIDQQRAKSGYFGPAQQGRANMPGQEFGQGNLNNQGKLMLPAPGNPKGNNQMQVDPKLLEMYQNLLIQLGAAAKMGIQPTPEQGQILALLKSLVTGGKS